MSDKAWCPACESYTSSLRESFDNGWDCPSCGLGNDAWHEVVTIRAARDDDALSQRFAELRIENDKLGRLLADTELKLNTIKAAIGKMG